MPELNDTDASPTIHKILAVLLILSLGLVVVLPLVFVLSSQSTGTTLVVVSATVIGVLVVFVVALLVMERFRKFLHSPFEQRRPDVRERGPHERERKSDDPPRDDRELTRILAIDSSSRVRQQYDRKPCASLGSSKSEIKAI